MNTLNFKKVVIIIRHVSGSGSSTFANYLEFVTGDSFYKPINAIICCADDYYIEKYGSYKFNAQELGAAHKYCREKFENALQAGFQLIICTNTNTGQSEFQPYLDLANEYGYTVFTIITENRNNTKNIHNVPEETLQKQEQRLKNSIKLR